jgi:RNA polymerase sigma-70 factor (ECF subfamily)
MRQSTLAQTPRDKTERFLKHLEPLQEPLAAFCRRSLCNRSDVTDVLQSAVASAFRDFDLYAEGTNFRAWMFRYVSYEVLNRNRAVTRRREVELPREVPDTRATPGLFNADDSMGRMLEEPELVLDQCDDALAEALLELSDLERNIFLLRSIGDFKYREVAAILEVPIGTVMGLLSRSRERLRHRLLDYAKTHGWLPLEREE